MLAPSDLRGRFAFQSALETVQHELCRPEIVAMALEVAAVRSRTEEVTV